MKIITELTQEQQDLLRTNGHIFTVGGEGVFYNLPQWYKQTEIPNSFEILNEAQLPAYALEHIPSAILINSLNKIAGENESLKAEIETALDKYRHFYDRARYSD